jgi:uncharacterized membrane protein
MQTHTDFVGFPGGAFFILPLLYLIVTLGVVAIITIGVWRIMRAQEATAEALRRIADAFERRSP